MWRYLSYIPRAVRQQFHGPRASAGVCVEEEKAERDTEKYVCHGNKEGTPAICLQYQEQGPEEESQNGGPHYEHGDWWKCHCHEESWARFPGPHRTLDAVTWGAAVVLGLHLSRQPNLLSCLELLRDPEKRQTWRELLFRVAFAMPPDRLLVSRSIIQQEDADQVPAKSKMKAPDRKATQASEEKKTLTEVMQDFVTSCRQYAAVGNSVAGVWAAEKGHMTTAVEHLQLACQLGHAPAYFNLAVCYEMGLGVEKDKTLAASYYRMAADVGHAQAIFNLGLMTLRGEGGLVKDSEKAIELLTRAAQRGLAQAQTYLGVYYTEDDDNQMDFQQAASFFRAAASQNDAEGQYFLGICYENGWGVESSDEEAARLYTAAADTGHDGAMYNLAAFHEYGLGGVKRDMEEAMALYKRSAELGNESAKFRLQEVEARLAISQWSDQNGSADIDADPVPPLCLRRSPHGSSPTLSDYVRESITFWVEKWTSWSSLSQTVEASPAATEGPSRATFTLGDEPVSQDCRVAGERAPAVAENANFTFVDMQQRVPQSCVAGLHRTSTMPELRTLPCECQ